MTKEHEAAAGEQCQHSWRSIAMPSIERDPPTEPRWCSLCGALASIGRVHVPVNADPLNADHNATAALADMTAYATATEQEWHVLKIALAEKDAQIRDLTYFKEAIEMPYGHCYTLPDGNCIGRGCMHDLEAAALAEAEKALVFFDEVMKKHDNCGCENDEDLWFELWERFRPRLARIAAAKAAPN